MADKPLFTLDAEGRWRLAYDPLQWIVQRRKTLPQPSEVGASAESRWRAVSFIGSTKRVLHRVLGEKGVTLTAKAQARLDTLPERFMDFIATLETVAALGQRESPEPDSGRTAAIHPLGGPEHQPGQERPPTGVVGARVSEAA